MTEQEINRRMEIAQDIKKEFLYSKSSGEWFWYDCDMELIPDSWHGPLQTFTAALDDATEPYESADSDEPKHVNTVHREHYGVSDSEQADEPELDADDLCSATKQRHLPNWNSVSVEQDGGETYIDVTCRCCGRSGCVGTTKTLSDGINW